jgi:peptidoglycan/xylan/chitin deacetylase (PgdA/CDA1 family)
MRLGAVPILMYHSISEDNEAGVNPYYRTCTKPAIFRQHMQFLAEQGYRTLNLDELLALLRAVPTGLEMAERELRTSELLQTSTVGHRPVMHERLVVITFDDGLHDFYSEAFPILQQYGFTATMFLPTGFIGDTRRHFRPSTLKSHGSNARVCLTWGEVRELSRAGFQFGSHTVNHPKLIDLDWPEIKSEIQDSKSEIEHHLGESISSFCYPFAFPREASFARALRDLLACSGYTCCATTEIGRVAYECDPFRLRRLPANSLDDAPLFIAKLEGAYDWLSVPQSASKALKNLRGVRRTNGVAATSDISGTPSDGVGKTPGPKLTHL